MISLAFFMMNKVFNRDRVLSMTHHKKSFDLGTYSEEEIKMMMNRYFASRLYSLICVIYIASQGDLRMTRQKKTEPFYTRTYGDKLFVMYEILNQEEA